MKKDFIRVPKRIISGIAAVLMLAIPVYSAFYINEKVAASEISDVASDSKYQISGNITLDYEKAFALAKKVENENKVMDKELLASAMKQIVDNYRDAATMTEDEILESIAAEEVKSFGVGAVTYKGNTILMVLVSQEEAKEEAVEIKNEEKEIIFEYMANEFEVELDKDDLVMTEEDEVGVMANVKGSEIVPDYYESEDPEIATVEIVGNSVLVKAVKKGETKVKIGLVGEDNKKKFAVINVKVKQKEILPESEPEPEPEPARPDEQREQGPLMFDNAVSMKLGDEMILKVKGGDGEGGVSYEVKNGTGAAVVLGNVIKANKAGTVDVIATKAADGIFKEARAMMTLMIEAVTTADVNAPAQTFISNLQNKHSAGSIMKSDASGKGMNENVPGESSAGEKIDVANHESPIEQVETVVDAPEDDGAWTVWLWFLIPIITSMVLVIAFARSRLK